MGYRPGRPQRSRKGLTMLCLAETLKMNKVNTYEEIMAGLADLPIRADRIALQGIIRDFKILYPELKITNVREVGYHVKRKEG